MLLPLFLQQQAEFRLGPDRHSIYLQPRVAEHLIFAMSLLTVQSTSKTANCSSVFMPFAHLVCFVRRGATRAVWSVC